MKPKDVYEINLLKSKGVISPSNMSNSSYEKSNKKFQGIFHGSVFSDLNKNNKGSLLG